MDFKERLKRKQQERAAARKPSETELELARVMPGILDDLVASLPNLSRKDALAELDFRVTQLSKHENGTSMFPDPPDFNTDAIERACEDLLGAFGKRGMTRKLALGQLVYELGRAARFES